MQHHRRMHATESHLRRGAVFDRGDGRRRHRGYGDDGGSGAARRAQEGATSIARQEEEGEVGDEYHGFSGWDLTC